MLIFLLIIGKLYYGSYHYQKTNPTSNTISQGGMGGIGGGALRLYSRRTIVDGRMSANGQDLPTVVSTVAVEVEAVEAYG